MYSSAFTSILTQMRRILWMIDQALDSYKEVLYPSVVIARADRPFLWKLASDDYRAVVWKKTQSGEGTACTLYTRHPHPLRVQSRMWPYLRDTPLFPGQIPRDVNMVLL